MKLISVWSQSSNFLQTLLHFAEKSNDMEAIYDEVKTLEKNVLDADPATPGPLWI